MPQQQPRRELAGRQLQARLQRIARSRKIAGFLRRLAQLKRGSGIVWAQLTSSLQMKGCFREIPVSEFKLAELAERGRRARIKMQGFFEEPARVPGSVIVSGVSLARSWSRKYSSRSVSGMNARNAFEEAPA